MISTHRLILLISFLASNLCIADEKKEIGVLVEHIRVNQTTATKILRDYRGDGPALRKKLQSLVENKQAELIETAYIIAQDGAEAKIDSIDEYIYPTEYDPPETPAKVTEKVAEGVNLTTPSSPTAFDARNLGNSLEVKVAINHDGLIKLEVDPHVVELIGHTTYGTKQAKVTQPLFNILRARTKLTVKSDRYALLGVLTPRDPKAKSDAPKHAPDKRVFIMLRATVLENPDKP